MENKILKFVGYWTMGLILMIFTVIVMRWATDFLDWARLDVGDLGTWVGGIGTVATLAMTIRLATAANRAARQDALDRAVVASAAIGFQLQKVATVLQESVEHFLDEQAQYQGLNYVTYSNKIVDVGTWNDDEILPLIVLPNHVSARLAALRPFIREIVSDMRDLAETHRYSYVQESLGERNAKIAGKLIRSRDMVLACLSQCQELVNRTMQ